MGKLDFPISTRIYPRYKLSDLGDKVDAPPRAHKGLIIKLPGASEGPQPHPLGSRVETFDGDQVATCTFGKTAD